MILCIVIIWVLWSGYHHLKKKRALQRRMEIGRLGEEETIQILEQLPGRKQILRNLYLSGKSGTSTTEIDAVMIHTKGIFVIENKNYTGKIYGTEADYQWTQVQWQDGKRMSRYFYNPIRQNEHHIRCLQRVISEAFPDKRIPSVSYVSVVTFNGRARLKKIRLHSANTYVLEKRQIRRKLRWKLFWMRRTFKRKQIELLSDRLRMFENPGKHIRKQHERNYERFFFT